ncbi:MAG: hypothetical protein OEY36_02410 [Gammaproteobacteria bacterium]|nr:hypothetical protein [Gammaproteobacteria bacterium]
MAEGKELLLQVSGVREVFTSEAVEENSKCRFCWSVSFTHKAALESFRADNNFDTFLKKQFKPNASDFISIDYLESA